MTAHDLVIPAKAGIQFFGGRSNNKSTILSETCLDGLSRVYIQEGESRAILIKLEALLTSIISALSFYKWR